MAQILFLGHPLLEHYSLKYLLKKKEEFFVHERGMGVRQAYSSAYTVKLCSIILTIHISVFFRLLTACPHMPLKQLALCWHFKLLLLLLLVILIPYSGQTNWVSFIQEVTYIFWLSSVGPFAMFVIWRMLLTPAPIPILMVTVVMAKCPIWQVGADLSSAPKSAHYVVCIISCTT